VNLVPQWHWLSFLFLLIIGTASHPPRALQFQALYGAEISTPQKDTEVLLQGFTWNARVNGEEGVWFRHLESKAVEISKMGITHIWFPPVSRSVSDQGYMPGDYYDVGTKQEKTFYGSKEELVRAVRAFRKQGILSIADIVINHRTASHQEDGVWNVFHHRSGKMMWEKWALSKDDYRGTGSPDSGENFEPAPDIDHNNARVRKDLIAWLNWLQSDLGFQGFRFDFVKGFDGRWVREYMRETNPAFTVGEYWSSMDYTDDFVLKPNQNAHRQKIVDWIDSAGGEPRSFDFTTKGVLQEAFIRSELWRLSDKNKKASGVLGWWPAKSVTFLDNHDTGGEQAHWPFPQEHLLKGYAYIMTHPGTPSVFWEHLFDKGASNRDRIVELIQIRHELGIHRDSKLQILNTTNSSYVASIDKKILLRLGEKSYRPGSEWSPRILGEGYTIYTRIEKVSH
jgi:alpha-amylase